MESPVSDDSVVASWPNDKNRAHRLSLIRAKLLTATASLDTRGDLPEVRRAVDQLSECSRDLLDWQNHNFRVIGCLLWPLVDDAGKAAEVARGPWCDVYGGDSTRSLLKAYGEICNVPESLYLDASSDAPK